MNKLCVSNVIENKVSDLLPDSVKVNMLLMLAGDQIHH